MAEFNVLTEPWIPVISNDGKTTEFGIIDVLMKAHELSEVVCENPLETYAVQRFLIAFLMDAYRLPHARDRKRLFDSGRFDPEVIKKYIELCRSEGVSFDLLDEKRPFYQAAYDKDYDTDDKKRSIGLLFHSEPRGNTPLHFSHNSLDNFQCTPSEAFRALLAAHQFAIAVGSQGYPSSVNDTPCYYVLLKGENLFETLCLSMLSIGEFAGLDYDSNPAAWRDKRIQIPKTMHADISLLEGLTFRPRRTTLLSEPEGMVKYMYNQPGQNYHANERWTDPHVSYSINKEGKYVTLKPQLGRMPWRDVGAYALSKENQVSRPAKILLQSDRIIDKSIPRIIMLFGLATSNSAKYDDMLSDRLSVPGDILLDVEKADSLRAAMNKIEQVASLIYGSVKDISNAAEHTKDGKKKLSEAANEAQSSFFARMHTSVFADYMPVLAEADTENPDWQEAPDAVIAETIKLAAMLSMNEFARKLGSTAKSLEMQTVKLRFFNSSLNKLLNGRKVDN